MKNELIKTESIK